MIGLTLLLGLAACAYGLWRLRLRAPSRQQRRGWSGVLRLACVIGAIRIGAIWLGLAGLRTSGWWQPPAFLLAMFGSPEIYLVRGLRAEPLPWAIAASAVLATTSVVWAAAFLWVADRLRSR
jgi:hypothetical protein